MEIKGTGLKCHFCALAPLNSLPTASPCASVLSGEGGAAGGRERKLLGGGFALLPHPQPWAPALHQGRILPHGVSSTSAFQIPWDLVKKQILFSYVKENLKILRWRQTPGGGVAAGLWATLQVQQACWIFLSDACFLPSYWFSWEHFLQNHCSKSSSHSLLGTVPVIFMDS